MGKVEMRVRGIIPNEVVEVNPDKIRLQPHYDCKLTIVCRGDQSRTFEITGVVKQNNALIDFVCPACNTPMGLSVHEKQPRFEHKWGKHHLSGQIQKKLF